MELEELIQRIRLPENAKQTIEKYSLKEEDYQNWRTRFYNDTKAFLQDWKASENHLQWILPFYLRIACEVYEEYQKNHIDDQVFYATFYDITIWCEECYRKHGCYGLEEAGWIAYSAKMKLFRLGRLQFEPMVLQEDLDGQSGTLKAGAHVLNVHIPAGEKMELDACVASIKQAENFFREAYEAYICDSWLLSPVLKEFLPETSNIVRFQDMFELVKVHHRFPQAEQRIFKDIRKDKTNYPEDTLLQRKAKEYILAGKDIGIGIGVIYK